MIELEIAGEELFNSQTNEFINIPNVTLSLEHSLISISKWESMYKRAFLSEKTGPRTQSEFVDYVRCMTLNKRVDPAVYQGISDEQYEQILKYIEDPATATTFKKPVRGRRGNAYLTSEIIYWEMITLGIPIECERWNLNRLLTLIRVCDEKGQPPKKMSQNDLLRQYAGVNAKRRPKKH